MSTDFKRQSPLSGPGQRPRTEQELRRDRLTMIVVLAIMLGIMALVIWLSSFGGGTVPEGIEYWPMMQ